MRDDDNTTLAVALGELPNGFIATHERNTESHVGASGESPGAELDSKTIEAEEEVGNDGEAKNRDGHAKVVKQHPAGPRRLRERATYSQHDDVRPNSKSLKHFT